MRYYSAPNVMNAVDFLSRTFPQYVFYSEPLNKRFSAVSTEGIARHYCPDQQLREIWNRKHRDRLQSKAIELVHVISEESGVPLNRLGITGSILLNVHKVSFSDIDLVVYVREETRKVKESLLSLYERKGMGVERLRGKKLSRWCKEMSLVQPFSIPERKKLTGCQKLV